MRLALFSVKKEEESCVVSVAVGIGMCTMHVGGLDSGMDGLGQRCCLFSDNISSLFLASLPPCVDGVALWVHYDFGRGEGWPAGRPFLVTLLNPTCHLALSFA